MPSEHTQQEADAPTTNRASPRWVALHTLGAHDVSTASEHNPARPTLDADRTDVRCRVTGLVGSNAQIVQGVPWMPPIHVCHQPANTQGLGLLPAILPSSCECARNSHLFSLARSRSALRASSCVTAEGSFLFFRLWIRSPMLPRVALMWSLMSSCRASMAASILLTESVLDKGSFLMS
jgi:hypothetical protein